VASLTVAAICVNHLNKKGSSIKPAAFNLNFRIFLPNRERFDKSKKIQDSNRKHDFWKKRSEFPKIVTFTGWSDARTHKPQRTVLYVRRGGRRR
jgi:hypothetical protein